MYTLYWAPGTAAFAPQAVLEEAGAPYALEPVDLRADAHRTAAYLALNPNGAIPVLCYDDCVLFETAAIVLALVDRHPEAGLAPAAGDPERAIFYKWLAFMSNTLQPAYKRSYYPERFSTDPADAGRIREKADADIDGHWDVLEEALIAGGGPFLLGSRYSAADIYLYMLATWYRPTATLYARCPAVAECVAAVRERPAIARIRASHGDP